MQWLESMNRQQEAKLEDMKFAAWAYGAAARVAIVSAMSTNPTVPYPSSYKEFWHGDPDDVLIVDGEEFSRTPEEESEIAWRMERDMLAMKLKAAVKHAPPDPEKGEQ